MMIAANLGFPRIGAERELKHALEAFWAGRSDGEALAASARALRSANWRRQAESGLGHIPSNDFSLYDHVLDTTAMLGAVPPRFEWPGGTVGLETYFAMARGLPGAPAMEMTKWFDTNYHYLVPELTARQQFRLASTKPVDEFLEAKALGILTRPVLVGPVTYLLLARPAPGAPDFDRLALLDRILPVYEEVLRRLAAAGAEWVQIDEPALVLDLDARARHALASAYAHLAHATPGLRLLVATYFGGLGDNLATALDLPVAGLHLDLVRAPEQLDRVLASWSIPPVLSLGVIDGRNVWRSDLDAALSLVGRAVARLGRGRVMVAPSCSLLHVPLDLESETGLTVELRSWMAFAAQKLDELATIARGAERGAAAIGEALAASRAAAAARASSSRIHNGAVARRAQAVGPGVLARRSPRAVRRRAQQAALALPPFPTTTIGSLPQTAEVRQARARFRRGEQDRAAYERFLGQQIERAVRFQERIGLDVLVHGEFERNDMVEHFGEQLAGFAVTRHGWVQSYGSRCVKPPVIFGDVARPHAMTVHWSRYTQTLTDRPVKGMLTGPITMLQWSFVRDDQPRAETAKQIALALRDEVGDLEAAGIRIIQIDEPALREGLPLRKADQEGYLRWAVDAFRLAASGVADSTQVHTHMCYADFNDIIRWIDEMDADVISIETSRSQMALLDAFVDYEYPGEIGPGVYDIHSPRIPQQEEIERLLGKAMAVLDPGQIWINPDCGLKTRTWDEVEPALRTMVAAAGRLRAGVLPAGSVDAARAVGSRAAGSARG
jgi:5-methyltetrahydropteroyltriglutamate--homocysteine methyltransferase